MVGRPVRGRPPGPVLGRRVAPALLQEHLSAVAVVAQRREHQGGAAELLKKCGKYKLSNIKTYNVNLKWELEISLVSVHQIFTCVLFRSLSMCVCGRPPNQTLSNNGCWQNAFRTLDESSGGGGRGDRHHLLNMGG